MNLVLQKFIGSSGFKLMALARLSQAEYSITLYLLNCMVSGLDQIVSTESELASLIGYEDTLLKKALDDLQSKNIVKIHYSDKINSSHNSFRIGLQTDLSRWALAYDEDASKTDALVFPFRRRGMLQVLEGAKKPSKIEEPDNAATWQRILESYVRNRSLDDDELEQATESAKVLTDTHPVDQVLLLIRHFGLRIPTLSLLASSWQHYHEIFEDETLKVDIMDARQKHLEMDQKLRESAQRVLDKEDVSEMKEEELTVLRILTKHRHPRRQLFWAYQAKGRYPNLEEFFTENIALMLPVTTSGHIVKLDKRH